MLQSLPGTSRTPLYWPLKHLLNAAGMLIEFWTAEQFHSPASPEFSACQWTSDDSQEKCWRENALSNVSKRSVASGKALRMWRSTKYCSCAEQSKYTIFGCFICKWACAPLMLHHRLDHWAFKTFQSIGFKHIINSIIYDWRCIKTHVVGKVLLLLKSFLDHWTLSLPRDRYLSFPSWWQPQYDACILASELHDQTFPY